MNRLIAAVDRRLGIGKHGIIPWHIPIDEQFFTDKTKSQGGHVLTGGVTFRETYHGPLKDRHNYILTHDDIPIEGVIVVHDLAKFLDECAAAGKDLWVAGGAKVFEQVIEMGKADELYLTHIDADFGCDRFFPAFEEVFERVESGQPQEQNGFHFTVAVYKKKVA